MRVHIISETTGRVEFVIEKVKYVREKDKKTFIVATVVYPTNKLQVMEFQSVNYHVVVYP